MTLYKATAQGNVQMTPEEEAEFIASQTPSIEQLKEKVRETITRLEGAPNYLNRGARELQLRLMEKEAGELAPTLGVTKEQLLSATPYYVKLKALDVEIAALRAQL